MSVGEECWWTCEDSLAGGGWKIRVSIAQWCCELKKSVDGMKGKSRSIMVTHGCRLWVGMSVGKKGRLCMMGWLHGERERTTEIQIKPGSHICHECYSSAVLLSQILMICGSGISWECCRFFVQGCQVLTWSRLKPLLKGGNWQSLVSGRGRADVSGQWLKDAWQWDDWEAVSVWARRCSFEAVKENQSKVHGVVSTEAQAELQEQ